MKTRETPSSEAALFRLVLARVVAGLIVIIAIVLAPPVVDSIATLDLTSAQLANEMDDGGKPVVNQGIDVQETKAEPTEPSASY
ncbi:MAG TPA: hypothetical protein VE421_07860 [Burkholderiaceae bacterium]|jgi:hypothetical protein|nr:hypothetical protein [Burkholderiaceae bacterium]